MNLQHQVSPVTRTASRWDPEYHVWVTPQETTWAYIDPSLARGARTVDGIGDAILVACWIDQPEHLPYSACLTPQQAATLDNRLNYGEEIDRA